MHERHLPYPRHPHRTRPWTAYAGPFRYALAWIAATSLTVLALSIALPGPRDATPSLASAIERASCRLEHQRSQPSGAIGAALGAGKVVVRYRATLTATERTRLRRIARRLAGLAVTLPGAPASPAAVEATRATSRLDCPRVDRYTEQALMLFTLSLEDAR